MPLLFVHGAYAGAWCWDEYFLPYFADRGFDCHALSLRGHGASAGRELLDFASLDDYVADVERVAGDLDEPPLLIGHSMGGVVAQRYAASGSVAGLVLIASVPPGGLWASTMALWWRDPGLLAELALVQSGQPRLASFDRLRAALFAPDMSAEKARRYLVRMQSESSRALFDLSAMHWYAQPVTLGIPSLVIGGACDALFGPDAVQATARWYGTQAVILPALGHTLMLDEGWQEAAHHILRWIAATYTSRG